jgi:hypothetical protein
LRAIAKLSVRYFIERSDSQQVVICTLIARDFDKNIVGQIDQDCRGQNKG